MFKQILTLLRGRAYDAEQAFTDRNAVPLLDQQIRDAAQAIQSARRAVAVAIAHNEQEKSQHTTIIGRLADLEIRAMAALEKGHDGLARDAADAIAYLEAERDASQAAQAQFTAAIDKLKAVVRTAEARLRDLQRGERLARATEEAQRLDVSVLAGPGLATLDEAEETLARLRFARTRMKRPHRCSRRWSMALARQASSRSLPRPAVVRRSDRRRTMCFRASRAG